MIKMQLKPHSLSIFLSFKDCALYCKALQIFITISHFFFLNNIAFQELDFKIVWIDFKCKFVMCASRKFKLSEERVKLFKYAINTQYVTQKGNFQVIVDESNWRNAPYLLEWLFCSGRKPSLIYRFSAISVFHQISLYCICFTWVAQSEFWIFADHT